jgi:hypothetical protein
VVPALKVVSSEFVVPVLKVVSSVILKIVELAKIIFLWIARGVMKLIEGEKSIAAKVEKMGEVAMADMPKDLYSDLVVNRAKIKDRPPPFNPDLLLEFVQSATPEPALPEILTQFDEICAEDPSENFVKDHVSVLTKEAARVSIEEHFIRFIEGGHEKYASEAINKIKMKTIAESINGFLLGVIIHLRNPCLSLSLKREALKGLSLSGMNCAPAREEEVRKSFLRFSNQMDGIKEAVLEGIQALKETLIGNIYWKAEHGPQVLNLFRRELGKELGLDTSVSDPYIDGYAKAIRPWREKEKSLWSERYCVDDTKEKRRASFYHAYTPQNILNGMANWMREKIAKNPTFLGQLVDFIKGVKGVSKDGPVPEDCFDSLNGKLTDQGVRFLMIHFEFLTVKE